MTGDRGARECAAQVWLITDPNAAAAMASGLLLPAVLGVLEKAAVPPDSQADRGQPPTDA